MPAGVLFKQLKLGPMANFGYVFGDPVSKEAAIVDPAFDVENHIATAEAMGLKVTQIWVTHGHFDHTQGVPTARKVTGARVFAHPDSPVKPDVAVGDGDAFTLGDVRIEALHTPGHEPTSVCFVVDDKYVLTGDTLFVGECGRADLPGSDPGDLRDSLLETLAALPRHLIVCSGHDYGVSPTSTLEREFRENYVLEPRTREEFTRFVLAP